MSTDQGNVLLFPRTTSGNVEPVIAPVVGVGGGGGNGGMDDVLRRLGTVEKDVSEIKTQVGAIAAVLPHLATKSDLSDMRGSLSGLETSILKWVVATGVAIIMVVIAAAKLL